MSLRASRSLWAAICLLVPAVFSAVQDLQPTYASLPTIPPPTRTMRLGVMAYGGNYYAPFTLYANWVKVGSPLWMTNPGTTCTGYDAAGMPINPKGEFGKWVANPTGDPWVSGGYPIAPTGKWTLLWDGPGYARLNVNGVMADTDDVTQRITGLVTNNQKVYPSVPVAPGLHSPTISVQIIEDAGAVTNLRVYDHYIVDPLHPPKFHPLAMAKLAGTACFRAKDMIGIDGGCPIINFSDHTSTATASIADGWGAPVQDVVDLVNALGCDLWWSIPHQANNQYGVDLAAFLKATLAPGRNVWIEYTNEPWNGGASYPQFGWIAQQAAAYRLTNPGNPVWDVPDPTLSARWYVLRAAQFRDIVRQTLPTAKLVLNAQWGNSSYTLNYARNCADLFDSQGRISTDAGFTGPAQFEAESVAPYVVVPSGLTAAQADALTLAQVVAQADSYYAGLAGNAFGALAKAHAANVATLNSTGRTVKLLCYEGGPSAAIDTGTRQAVNTVAASLHPDAREQALALFTLFDSLGYHTFIKNGLAGTYVGENSLTHSYSTFTGLEQPAGDGTANLPLIADATGMAIAPDLSRCNSPVGAAIAAWQAMVAPQSVTTALQAELANLQSLSTQLTASSSRLNALATQLGTLPVTPASTSKPSKR